MDRAADFEKLKQSIVEQLGTNPEAITETASFTDNLDADSLDLLQLITALEDEFEVEIPDDDFEGIKTVGDALDVLERLRGGE